jgi:hypothetical protein
VTAEKATDRTHEESTVKIAAEALGPATGVDKESPEGIFDGGASQVGQTVGPGVSGGEIDKKKAVTVTTGAGAVAVADVGAKGVEDRGGAGDGATTITALDSRGIADGERGFCPGGDVEAGPEMGENLVVELAAAKKPM